MSPIQKTKGIQTNIMIGKMTLSLPYCYWRCSGKSEKEPSGSADANRDIAHDVSAT